MAAVMAGAPEDKLGGWPKYHCLLRVASEQCLFAFALRKRHSIGTTA
jgi:hypothetical protein